MFGDVRDDHACKSSLIRNWIAGWFIRMNPIHNLYPYLGVTSHGVVDYFLKAYKTKISTVLDPFVGSGTTLVQANILNKNSIGIDVCEFSAMICRAKTQQYYLPKAKDEVSKMIKELSDVLLSAKDEPILRSPALSHYCQSSLFKYRYQDLLRTILCKSLTSAFRSANSYTNGRFFDILRSNGKEAILNVREFSRIRTASTVNVIRGDSRTVSLDKIDESARPDVILTSPPYIGKINYHDTFDSLYRVFGIQRHDEEEIGSRSKGEGFSARRNYVKDMVEVFTNMREWIAPNSLIILIVEDRFELFGEIAKKAALKGSRIDGVRLAQNEEALLLSYKQH